MIFEQQDLLRIDGMPPNPLFRNAAGRFADQHQSTLSFLLPLFELVPKFLYQQIRQFYTNTQGTSFVRGVKAFSRKNIRHFCGFS